MATLIGHWPLAGDVHEQVNGHHGAADGLSFAETDHPRFRTAAAFAGHGQSCSVAHDSDYCFGGQDFSISLWLRCPKPMSGVFGTLLSKFDGQTRTGFNLYVAGSAPGYNSMSDARHLHFGIDDGHLGTWQEHGRPDDDNSLIPCLIAHDGELFCGIADAPNPTDAAHVYRMGEGATWHDCGRVGDDPCHLSVQSMIVHDGELYAGTGVWDWRRAWNSEPDFTPTAARVFRYDGKVGWQDLGPIGNAPRIMCLGSFAGDLYAGLDRPGGGHVMRYDGEHWQDCGVPDGRNIECLLPVGGVLYAATHGNVYRYDGQQQWHQIADEPFGINQIHSMTVYEDRLVCGTWPQGYVIGHCGGEDWEILGRIGIAEGMRECNEVMDLIVHNGKLYAGTIPKSQLYRYEDNGQWTLMGNLAGRPDWDAEVVESWCRITSLTTHQGRLHASTGSCVSRHEHLDPKKTLGRVLSMEAGIVASREYDMDDGWHHVAAIRKGRELQLYYDGKLAHTQPLPESVMFDLDNTQPLRIGCGPNGVFSGEIADVRFYRGALAEEEVQGMFAPGE